MRGSRFGICHRSRQFWASIAYTFLSYTSVELRTSSTPSMADSVFTCWDNSRISCGITSVTQFRSTSHPIKFVCFRRKHAILGEKSIPGQASMTKFPGFLNFCKMSFTDSLFFSSGCMKSLRPGFYVLFLYTRLSYRSFGLLDINFVHPRCVLFTSSGAS